MSETPTNDDATQPGGTPAHIEAARAQSASAGTGASTGTDEGSTAATPGPDEGSTTATPGNTDVEPGETEADFDKQALRDKVVEALKNVYDPEIPVSLYELGLIYEIDIDDTGHVDVIMTLTTPHCPEAQTLPDQVELEVRFIEGVESVDVEITWDPPWGPERMSEAAKLALGF